MKRCALLFLLLFVLVNQSVAMIELRLPFKGGESLILTRGYYDPYNPNGTTHQDYGVWFDDRFALDFVGNGCDSWQSPILAISDGVVVSSYYSSSYGNNVVVDHGGGYRSRYAHLDSSSVVVNQRISQGEELGKMGNTGNVFGSACVAYPGTHLHFAMYLNGVGVKPEPMSGYDSFNEGEVYTSNNFINPVNDILPGEYVDGWHSNTSTMYFAPHSLPFVDGYYYNGVDSKLGYPMNYAHQLPMEKPFGSGDIWVQDTEKDGHTFTLVLNPHVYNFRYKYLGIVFPVHGEIRNYWYYHFFELGAPATNEYYWPEGTTDYVVQWFEPRDNEYKSIAWDTNSRTIHDSSEVLVPLDASVLFQYQLLNTGCEDSECAVGGGYNYIPTNLVASAISDSQIYLAWTGFDSPDDYSNFEYRVYNSTGSYIGDSEVPNFSHVNLSSNTEYCYEIAAVFDGTETEVSSEICARTLSSAPSVVVYPAENFSLVKTGDFEVRLSWDFSENEDAPTLYSLVYSFADGEFLDELNTGRNSEIYDELEAGIQYCFYIRMELEGVKSVATSTKCITLSEPIQTSVILPPPALRVVE